MRAFVDTDRQLFVPEHLGAHAYMDVPLAISKEATMSAPHIHAMCAEILKDNLLHGRRVLDVSCGSGFFSCVLSRLVGDRGSVLGIDIDPNLVSFSLTNATKNLLMNRRLNSGSLQFMVEDGRKVEGAFDAIHVAAMSKNIPVNLKRSLKVGGCMTIPVNGVLLSVKRISDTDYDTKNHGQVSFVPLR